MTSSNIWSRRLRMLSAASATVVLAACSVTPEPLTSGELAEIAKADKAQIFDTGEPIIKPLTLDEAMRRVLEYNLDRRAKLMEEALAMGQLDIDRFSMWPTLDANGGRVYRSEPEATRSEDYQTGVPSTGSPTISQDEWRTTGSLGLTWNILDFGVSYFTAQQNADRALIVSERRRKAVSSLLAEVRLTFWRAAAAQELADEVRGAVAEAEDALRMAEMVETERLRNPTEAMRMQKAILEMLRELDGIDQELASAKAELASLISAPPGESFKLEVPADLTLPDWNMTVDEMEEMAFARNPDLREQIYQRRIAADETRKAIVQLLPGISFNTSLEYDSNSFLVDNHWNEAGAKVAWNLMNVLSGPAKIEYAETNEKVQDAKRLALSMALIAQVHVGLNSFQSATRTFKLADRLALLEERLSSTTATRQQENAQSNIERITAKVSNIAAQLRRFNSYAQLQAAYGRMQTTLGIDALPPREDAETSS